jgi:RHS repeat-associated protein
MPDGAISSGVEPFLAVPSLMGGADSSVQVRVVDASVSGAADGAVMWSGRMTGGWARVGVSLPAGGAYRVDVSDDGVRWTRTGWLVVRGAWSAGGPDSSVGGISVSSVSGGVSWGWASPGLPGPVGAGSVSLGWSAGWAPPASLRPGLPGGLPPGWRVAVGSGSPWASVLVRSADGIARMVGWDGSVLVFARNGDGVWVQVTGGAPGFSNELRRVDGDEWEFVSAEGTTTRFAGGATVSGQQVFRVSRVFSGGRQVASVAWDGQGRVASVTNEVGRSAELSYAGAGGAGCASSSWPGGWARVPAGLLCAIGYPDGTSTQLGYVAGVSGEAQVALVKDPGEVATSLGWDARGRLVAERGTFANRVALVDPAAEQVLTRVSYDSAGRATSVRLASGATQRWTLPQVDERVLKAWVKDRDRAPTVTASSTLTAGDYRLGKSSWLDPTSWVGLKSQDASGRMSRVEVDERGRVARQVDGLGRVTTYKYNDLGLVVGTTGPTAGGQTAQTGQDFDTTGAGTREKDLVGLRALVGAGGKRVPEFWAATPTRGGVSYSWSGRERGWAGQATGVWDPPASAQQKAREAGGWALRVESTGADVRVRIGSQVCQVDAQGSCRVPAWAGDFTQVSVEVSRGAERGSFAVAAAPVGQQPTPIGFDEVTPGYGLVTQASTNDVFAGRAKDPETVMAFADPASGRPSQVNEPGGLVSRYVYNDAWDRLTQVTTPGGAVQVSEYWADDATVSLPGVCGGGTVTVSGQMRSVTRQDGSIVSAWPDLSGRVVAEELVGPGGDTQTTCTDYFADGVVRSVRVFNDAGQLVESSVTDPAVNGDYRVSRTTITAGPGAGDVVIDEVWSQTTSNLLGQVVEATGSSGVISRSTYDALGQPVTVTETAPDGTTLTTAYTYRVKDGQVASVTVNGVRAATISYDDYARVSSVTYPGGAQTTYSYDQAGRGKSVILNAAGQRWSHALEMTAFGRIAGERLTRGGTANEQRAYAYDPDTARLTRAAIASGTGDSAVSRTFDYGFGDQAASCSPAGYAPGRDGLRTSGKRDGTGYVTCYDDAGRAVSTTDPLVTGGADKAEVAYDGFGRVTAIGGADPVGIAWGLGASITRLDQGGDDTAVITMQDLGGTTLLRTITTATGTSSVRYAGSFTFATDVTGAPGAVIATQYALPGGVQVTVTGGVATATFPDLAGSAMATLTLPALTGGSGSSTLAAADRFGPYGEPLGAPSGGDGIKDYTWRAGMGIETLPGSASITVMGARPYHPGLGLFLTPDPLIDGGNALYAYTSGDPINYRDPSGGSEESNFGVFLAALGGGIAAIIAGGAAVGAIRTTNLYLAKAATWISGVAGAAATGAGIFVAVKAGADSDTGLMIAGIAIAAAGAGFGLTGVIGGMKNIRKLKSPRRQSSFAESEITYNSDPRQSNRQSSAIDRSSGNSAEPTVTFDRAQTELILAHNGYLANKGEFTIFSDYTKRGRQGLPTGQIDDALRVRAQPGSDLEAAQLQYRAAAARRIAAIKEAMDLGAVLH